MNFEEASNYIQSAGKFSAADPLLHARKLMAYLGNPQDQIPVIHVAGTNGKGSVCAYLDSMLRQGGGKVGLFTSPHLVMINERFRINGEMIDDASFVSIVSEIRRAAEQMMEEGEAEPGYFELIFALGMVWFAKEKVDYAVVETGLGGRLDATNTVARPLVSIITSISLDHVEFLGDTVEKIAAEKAGIIKSGVPLVYDAGQPSVREVLETRAREVGAEAYGLETSMVEALSVTTEEIVFRYKKNKLLKIPCIGKYQMMNCALAWAAMDLLKERHQIGEEALKKGLAETRWEGRMETVAPGIILDGAHNEDGIRCFIETAEYFKKNHEITVLFSAVSDKNYEMMIRQICDRVAPSRVITTEIQGERCVDAGILAEEFLAAGCEWVRVEKDIGSAFRQAAEVKGEGLLFCVGSLYLIGEIKAYLQRKGQVRREEYRC